MSNGRMRWGTHGKVSERVNGTWKMTVRPTPYVFSDEDIAMLLGRAIGILEYEPYYDDPQTYADTMGAIFLWERKHGTLTQQMALGLINDSYYLSQYEQGCDSHQYFDGDNEAHRAMLMKVRQIWPNFCNKRGEDETLEE
mgnify:CR=1 FL=1|tara:strand:+ start:583 stop:1002 length:420 start_codon:yes stop_codon:yes gene_type:complete